VIEARLGSKVVMTESRTGGFTPGFASLVVTAAGTTHFVKAASLVAQRGIAEAYRAEGRALRTLPPGVPAPRLQWIHDSDDWVVLCIEAVDGDQTPRPWSEADVQVASDMLVSLASALTPAPGLGVTDFATAYADWPACWDHVRTSQPSLPHLDEAAELASRFAEVTAGDTLVHGEVRDDNLLFIDDDTVVLCDWKWPARGAAWIDSLLLLIGPRHDGFDVNLHIASHPLLASVPGESIDIVLALFAGYYFRAAEQPSPASSKYLQTAAIEHRDALWNWLSERRGW
jgi:aminoglycoside phosphotransferase (APT) family kinase protein